MFVTCDIRTRVGCVTLQSIPINESYCGEAEQNGPLVGNIAVESSPILTFSDTQLTSVAAAAVNGHAIIYLGTHHGHLKKVSELSRNNHHVETETCLCSMWCITEAVEMLLKRVVVFYESYQPTNNWLGTDSAPCVSARYVSFPSVQFSTNSFRPGAFPRHMYLEQFNTSVL